MCFTPGHTSDQHHSNLTGNLTDTLRARLLQTSRPKSNTSKLPASRRSSPHGPKTEAKIVTLTKPDHRSKTAFKRLGTPAEMSSIRSTGGMATSLSGDGLQTEQFASDSKNLSRQDTKVFTAAGTAAQFVSKMKTKQMKGMMKGVGKELRRAASTVGDKFPGLKKKQLKEEKERQELLGSEPQKPQARNPDEIKKAYGYAGDTRQEASLVHDKLHERGEKLSAIQNRTTELEADAANFTSLTGELVKKIESKKWYEI